MARVKFKQERQEHPKNKLKNPLIVKLRFCYGIIALETIAILIYCFNNYT